MKIVYLVERPYQFEAPFFCYVSLDKKHDLRVWFTAKNPFDPVFDEELGRAVDWGIDLRSGYSWTVVPRRWLRWWWLAKNLRRGSCDLLIVNRYTRLDHLVATWLARRAGIKTALRLDGVRWARHSTSPGHKSRRRLIYSFLQRWLYDLFLGAGSETTRYLEECGVDEEKQRGLFPYAVHVEYFRTESQKMTAEERKKKREEHLGLQREEHVGSQSKQRAVLAVAKLNPREGPRKLLEALPFLPDEVRLVVAGDGPERKELENLAENCGPGRTTFLGYVPYPELPALYGAVDLFVHAASDERWGVSVAEALACGLPVVASDQVGAAWDLIEEEANGWIYRHGTAAGELAHLVGKALALDRTAVAAANSEILKGWDYEASWRYLLTAAERIGAGSGS